MANNYNSLPITLDTDTNSWFSGQTLQKERFGLRVWKIALYANASTTAGTVTVTEPNSGIPLIAPMAVPAASVAGTVLYYDNPTQLLQWRDFKATGLTATGTTLMVWYRV
jgi:hypothetical protein